MAAPGAGLCLRRQWGWSRRSSRSRWRAWTGLGLIVMRKQIERRPVLSTGRRSICWMALWQRPQGRGAAPVGDLSEGVRVEHRHAQGLGRHAQGEEGGLAVEIAPRLHFDTDERLDHGEGIKG